MDHPSQRLTAKWDDGWKLGQTECFNSGCGNGICGKHGTSASFCVCVLCVYFFMRSFRNSRGLPFVSDSYIGYRRAVLLVARKYIKIWKYVLRLYECHSLVVFTYISPISPNYQNALAAMTEHCMTIGDPFHCRALYSILTIIYTNGHCTGPRSD